MDIKDIANLKLGPLEPLVARIYRYAKRFPIVRARIDAEYAPIVDELRKMAKPYVGKVESYPTLPEEGVAREDVLTELRTLDGREADIILVEQADQRIVIGLGANRVIGERLATSEPDFLAVDLDALDLAGPYLVEKFRVISQLRLGAADAG